MDVNMRTADDLPGDIPLRQRPGLVAGLLGNRVLRNILTVVSGTAGAQAVTLAVMPIITRLYGPDAYGALGVFMGLVWMLTPVAALTYPMAIVLPRHDDDARAIIRLSVLVALVVTSLTMLVCLTAGPAWVDSLGVQAVETYLWLLPLVMLAGCALEIAQQWMIRQQRYVLTAKVAVSHSLVHNGLRVLGGLLHATPGMLIVTTGFGPALQAAMLGLAYQRSASKSPLPTGENPSERPAPLATIARRYHDFPLYRAPQMLINAVSQHLPTLVLAGFFGPAAAGFFALCRQALTMPTQLIGKSVTDVYYPRIVSAIHERQPIAGMLGKAVAGLALVGCIPFGTVVVLGPDLFAFVFGPQWYAAGEQARWLAIAEYAVFISRPCTVAVPALSLQGKFLAFEIVSTVLRVGALMIGALWLGAALSTVAAFAMASVLIYTALVVIAMIASHRWYTRQEIRNTR